MLEVQSLSYSVRGRHLVDGAALKVAEGEFVGIIGPNGSGKSTLLKNIYKVLRPQEGRIDLLGRDLLRMSNRDMAQCVAVVAQEQEAGFDFTVEEVVMMGRRARKGLLETAGQDDHAAVRAALRQVELEALLERSFLSLSGGEKQRVVIARALAQDTQLLILDEPTNHLDIGSQLKVLELLRNSGKTVLAALHDLALAARYCTRLYVMQGGHVVAQGPPEEVVTSALVRRLYGVDADLFHHRGSLCINYSILPPQ